MKGKKWFFFLVMCAIRDFSIGGKTLRISKLVQNALTNTRVVQITFVVKRLPKKYFHFKTGF